MMAPRTFPTHFPKGMLDAQCPCGGTRKLRLCCFSHLDGNVRPPMPNILPPSPISGYAHPKCYMAFTEDCSQEISAEHYISLSVLNAMGKEIMVSGMPWQNPGTSNSFGKNSLTAKVLCRRHNSALSPIDDAAATFFSRLNWINEKLSRPAYSKKFAMFAIRGELLELWALKTLMGIFQAGIARQSGNALKESFLLRVKSFASPLANTPLRQPLGMYIESALNHQFTIENSLAMAPLTSDPGNDVVGLLMKFAGMDIKFFFEAATVNFTSIQAVSSHRPTDLAFVSSKNLDERLFVIKLGWSAMAPKTITFTMEI